MSTVVSEKAQAGDGTMRRAKLWRRGLLALCLIALFALALWLYLHTLNLPFDRDSYDEGVYWQTLRAMAAGYPLYRPTFYSQPPAFLLSVYPIYALFGQTIWSARLGVVAVALLGLAGAFLLGKALRGPLVGLITLALLMLNPLYLAAAQTLQAEGPQVAFSVLAVAFAYLWWERPGGRRGLCYAALCTLTLTLSIFSKLFGLAALLPIVLLALAQCWRSLQSSRRYRLPGRPGSSNSQEALQRSSTQSTDVLPQVQTRQMPETAWSTNHSQLSQLTPFGSLLLGCAVFLLAILLILLPFASSFPAFWSQVVTFHTAAKSISSAIGNSQQIRTYLLRNLLSYTALYGTAVALWRRDWRALPLLAWLLASLYLLWQQAPLFAHHFVILVPALVGLSIMGLGPFKGRWRELPRLTYATSVLCLLLVLATLVGNVQADRSHYQAMRAQGNSESTDASLRVAHDLQAATQPGQFVITDAQFIAGLAQRNTPPELVDTSYVRINTGFVTTQQVTQLAEQPHVQAVLFYSGRLQTLPGLHTWVSQHFRRVHSYGPGQELWLKV